MDGEVQISCCPPAERSAALRILHAGLPEDQQAGLVQALHALPQNSESAFQGLLVALRAKEMVGASWIQPAPGRTALLWPPSVNGPAAQQLMQTAAEWLDNENIVLAQILGSSWASYDLALLSMGGFKELAELAYLTVDRKYFPTKHPSSELQFEPYNKQDCSRLEDLISKTYQGSLDCPDLNGVREICDVIEGYLSQGTSGDEHWFFARKNRDDVGVLILTPHTTEQWELVYMGIIPLARGSGLGKQLVQFALWHSGCVGADRIVLAVDQANQPALNMYHSNGFVVWDRRTVFARFGRGQ